MKHDRHLVDAQYFEQLYREYHSWLYCWLHKNLKHKQQAEDVAHDTFEKIMHAKQAASLDYPKSFLAQIATRLIIDRRRRQQLEQAYLDYLIAQDAQLQLENPENILQAVELLDNIAQMLDAMDESVRQIFILRYIDKLSQTEIAKLLNISRRKVQLSLIKALQHCDSIID